MLLLQNRLQIAVNVTLLQACYDDAYFIDYKSFIISNIDQNQI